FEQSRLREAKGLSRPAARSFASLRMTGLDLAGGVDLSSSFEPCLVMYIEELEILLMVDEAVALAVRKVQALGETLRNNVERVIIGKREMIDLLLVALLSDGHVL